MVGLALVPLVIPIDHLVWTRWQVTIVVLALLGVLCICAQAFRQSREEKDQAEMMQGIASKLEVISIKPTVPITGGSLPEMLQDSDPHVYVELTDKREGWFPRSGFVLHNRGAKVAHKIQVQSLNLKGGTINFHEVDFLAPNEEKEVIPDIPRNQIFTRHDMISVVRGEWDATSEFGNSEFTIHPSATYTDATRRPKFEVSFDLIYFPVRDLLNQSHSKSIDRKPVWETRNTTFRRLPT